MAEKANVSMILKMEQNHKEYNLLLETKGCNSKVDIYTWSDVSHAISIISGSSSCYQL